MQFTKLARISLIGLSTLFGACAHTPDGAALADAAQVRIEQERAKNYLTALTVKKNRFLEAHGYDADYSPEAGGTAPSHETYASATPCNQISLGLWAQNLSSNEFDVFTRTMERCYGSNG